MRARTEKRITRPATNITTLLSAVTRSCMSCVWTTLTSERMRDMRRPGEFAMWYDIDIETTLSCISSRRRSVMSFETRDCRRWTMRLRVLKRRMVRA